MRRITQLITSTEDELGISRSHARVSAGPSVDSVDTDTDTDTDTDSILSKGTRFQNKSDRGSRQQLRELLHGSANEESP